MIQPPFATPIETIDGALAGPWRSPRQMLAEQTYDGHASIHDDATAAKLGFKGGTIEGPTHFSQFAPLCHALWGRRWFETGSLSAHYKQPVFAGEKVRALVVRNERSDTVATIKMVKEDGSEILEGTVAVGDDAKVSRLSERMIAAKPPANPVILHAVRPGMVLPRHDVRLPPDKPMGPLYPFSLMAKLAAITEPSPWYDQAAESPWGRPIIPAEMISVLLAYTVKDHFFPCRGPAVGLFADQEIRLLDGPLLVDETYAIEREVVGLTGSRRTESLWVETRLYDSGTDRLRAVMLLNTAFLIESYAAYEVERQALYGG
jgi:acyl dehydratase